MNEEIMNRLEEGVKELKNSDRYREYLRTVARFHKYSVNNSILIHMQRPDATRVAGYKAWQSLGRKVNAGEHGIKIITPRPYKRKAVDNNGEEQEIDGIAFSVGTVFDVSQTSGRELPQIAVELKGSLDDYESINDKLRSIAAVPIVFGKIDGSAKGYCTSNFITIREGMSDVHTIKTMIHETAHSLMHFDGKERSAAQKETEAESVAYIVCQHLGIDTSDYSFEYLASWNADKEFKDSLDAICKVSRLIIGRLDEKEAVV